MDVRPYKVGSEASSAVLTEKLKCGVTLKHVTILLEINMGISSELNRFS